MVEKAEASFNGIDNLNLGCYSYVPFDKSKEYYIKCLILKVKWPIKYMTVNVLILFVRINLFTAYNILILLQL
jgi:hypothetical protein